MASQSLAPVAGVGVLAHRLGDAALGYGLLNVDALGTDPEVALAVVGEARACGSLC